MLPESHVASYCFLFFPTAHVQTLHGIITGWVSSPKQVLCNAALSYRHSYHLALPQVMVPLCSVQLAHLVLDVNRLLFFGVNEIENIKPSGDVIALFCILFFNKTIFAVDNQCCIVVGRSENQFTFVTNM